MDFVFNFLGGANGNRFWSHDDTFTQFGDPTNIITSTSFVIGSQVGGPTSFSGSTSNQPLMLFTYLTPNQGQVLGPMTSIPYGYYEIQNYQTTFPQVPAANFGKGGVTGTQNNVTLVSNNIQLSTIPRRLYIFIREQNQDFYSNPNRCDAFFQISALNIQYQNQAGLFNSASMMQLYEICVKNHCMDSFTAWSGGPVYSAASWTQADGTKIPNIYGTVGSVLALEFGSDIACQDVLDAPGKLSSNTIQISVTCANMSQRAIVPTLFVVSVVEGVFEVVSANRSAISVGVLTSEDILDAQQRPGVDYYDSQEMNGGDFFSGLKQFFAKAHDFIKHHGLVSKGLTGVSALFPKAAPFTLPAAALAKSYGYGEGGCDQMMGHGDGVLMEYPHAGVLVGGRHMPKRNLRQRIHHMN